jgi:hypothetical protein
MKEKLLSRILIATTAIALSACVSSNKKHSNAAYSGEEGGSTQTWFYPLVNTDNYYSPRKGQSNLMLFKSGNNYWYKDDDGEVIWLLVQGNHFQSPRPDGKQVFCYRSGQNIYCQE